MKKKSQKMGLNDHLSSIADIFGGVLVINKNPHVYSLTLESLYEQFPSPANDRVNLQNDRKAVGEDFKKAVEEKKKELV